MSQVLFLSACVLTFCGVALTFGNPRPDLNENNQTTVATPRDDDDDDNDDDDYDDDDDECMQEAGLDPFIGKWVEVDNINKEKMIDLAGITGARRKFFLSQKLVKIYERKQEVWTVHLWITNSPKTREVIFTLGEPYEFQNLDGTRLKGVVVQIGSTLVGHYESLGPKKYAMTIVREVHGDIMLMTVLSGGITVKILYKRV